MKKGIPINVKKKVGIIMGDNTGDKLFEKKYTCPICDHNFTAKTVRTGKARMIRTDMDLRNVYEDIEPLKYDIILCQKCGYAHRHRRTAGFCGQR